MKDFLLNENFSMMSIPSDHLIPLDSTGVSTMSRTLRLIFNVENRTFELGYLNYELNNKEVRKAVVHCYYLSIDTRLSQFIGFLAQKYPDQASQAKISNICQITLKITITPTRLVYYNLILTGDTTGVMTFTPSEFVDSKEEVETDLSSLEPLINSIINDRRKPQVVKKKPINTDQQIISICRDIVNMSDQTTEKIKQLKDLLK